MAEEGFPECELVVGALVEVGGDPVGVREEGAGFAGADEAEALAAAAAPGLEVAAQRVGEKEPDVGVGGAQAAEKAVVAGPVGRKRERAVGDGPTVEQREKLFFGDEGDFGVGAGGAEGAQERERHDDIAEPVREADIDAGAAREGGEVAGGEIGGEEVALGFEAEPFGRHVLVAPAVVRPEPRGAEVVVGGEELFEPAVEAERDGGGGAAGGDQVGADLDAPESAAARENAVDAGGEFFRHEAGEFGGGADAAEEGGERALQPGVLIEEDADEALAAEDFQGFGEALLAREELHAETLAGGGDEGVGGRVVEGAEDDAELGERAGDDEGLRSLGFPVGEVRRADERRGGGAAVEGVGGEHLG